MHTYIQTRGKNTDYQFLGAAPAAAWWLEFRDATSFEQPTLIVKGYRDEWFCYLSGIASCRTDRVGTTIRYSIVMEGKCKSQDIQEALSRIATWLEDVASTHKNSGKQRNLGMAIDSKLLESEIESRLLSSSSQPLEIEKLFAAPRPGAESGIEFHCEHWHGSWVSSMYSVDARRNFLNRISRILAGKQEGFAAWLNLLSDSGEVITIAKDKPGECAVLIDAPSDNFPDIYDQIKIRDSTPQGCTSETKDIVPSEENDRRKENGQINAASKLSPQKATFIVVIWAGAALLAASIIIMTLISGH